MTNTGLSAQASLMCRGASCWTIVQFYAFANGLETHDPGSCSNTGNAETDTYSLIDDMPCIRNLAVVQPTE